ncbi:MAG TPA: phosphopantetheine-binding protein [Caldimonas sp.]|nr:phosphopantetheine-binding protein [Caldimonas sp.]
MNRELFDVVAGILTDEFDVDAARVRPDATLVSLGLDSLALMEFVFAVEDRFRTRIPEERLDPRQAGLTLARLVDALDAQLAAISSIARTDAASPT